MMALTNKAPVIFFAIIPVIIFHSVFPGLFLPRWLLVYLVSSLLVAGVWMKIKAISFPDNKIFFVLIFLAASLLKREGEFILSFFFQISDQIRI